MHSQDKGNSFIIIDEQTDHGKANEQIERNFFKKIDYNPFCEAKDKHFKGM